MTHAILKLMVIFCALVAVIGTPTLVNAVDGMSGSPDQTRISIERSRN